MFFAVWVDVDHLITRCDAGAQIYICFKKFSLISSQNYHLQPNSDQKWIQPFSFNTLNRVPFVNLVLSATPLQVSDFIDQCNFVSLK